MMVATTSHHLAKSAAYPLRVLSRLRMSLSAAGSTSQRPSLPRYGIGFERRLASLRSQCHCSLRAQGDFEPWMQSTTVTTPMIAL